MSGPCQSGKSSYIKALDPNALNVEAKGKDEKFYTVGMDLGSVRLNGFDCYLFGTPGLLRFSIMRRIVSNGSDGIIFIFDAAAPEKDDSAIVILNSIRKILPPNTPVVFLANKQDVEGARPPEVIRDQNYLPKNSKIFPTSNKTGLNIKESITYLVNHIYEEYSSLLQTLRAYEDDIEGLAQELKKDKVQMRDLLNNLEIKRFIEVDRIKKVFKVRSGLKYLA
ncbi:MAG: 50S ribosome-binding GTPase [Candidatus Lokiarchaeota archaeon]|nr:50S ribosome-binding GTPase [Candidatus Lokiarchaeota archaeon]